MSIWLYFPGFFFFYGSFYFQICIIGYCLCIFLLFFLRFVTILHTHVVQHIKILLHCTIRFTSLCKLFTYLSIQQKQKHFQCLEVLVWQLVPPGLPIIENGVHGTEKLLLKTQVCEDFALWSDSIIVQDQDGQNINKDFVHNNFHFLK